MPSGNRLLAKNDERMTFEDDKLFRNLVHAYEHINCFNTVSIANDTY